MSSVTLRNVSRNYDKQWAVETINLDIAEGEFITLLGPSGCGKTTTLRMVAGFLFPSSGQIFIGGEDVTTTPPNKRDTGMVFQNYALFPHMTVEQNIAFGLKMRGVPATERRRRVKEALDLVQLSEMANRTPKQLSGGQQQRVALARAVVIRPRVLLMDEPLGALDLRLRQDLQVEIRNVQRETGITTIYVTHDQSEALSMSDRVAVMRKGRIEQLEPPESLYRRPKSAFVANFVGRTNLIPIQIMGPASGGAGYDAEIADGSRAPIIIPQMAFAGAAAPQSACLLGFRPENAMLEGAGAGGVAAMVRDIRYFGAVRSVLMTTPGGTPLEVDLPTGAAAPALGEAVSVHWVAQESFLLPAEAPPQNNVA